MGGQRVASLPGKPDRQSFIMIQPTEKIVLVGCLLITAAATIVSAMNDHQPVFRADVFTPRCGIHRISGSLCSDPINWSLLSLPPPLDFPTHCLTLKQLAGAPGAPLAGLHSSLFLFFPFSVSMRTHLCEYGLENKNGKRSFPSWRLRMNKNQLPVPLVHLTTETRSRRNIAIAKWSVEKFLKTKPTFW